MSEEEVKGNDHNRQKNRCFLRKTSESVEEHTQYLVPATSFPLFLTFDPGPARSKNEYSHQGIRQAGYPGHAFNMYRMKPEQQRDKPGTGLIVQQLLCD